MPNKSRQINRRGSGVFHGVGVWFRPGCARARSFALENTAMASVRIRSCVGDIRGSLQHRNIHPVRCDPSFIPGLRFRSGMLLQSEQGGGLNRVPGIRFSDRSKWCNIRLLCCVWNITTFYSVCNSFIRLFFTNICG